MCCRSVYTAIPRLGTTALSWELYRHLTVAAVSFPLDVGKSRVADLGAGVEPPDVRAAAKVAHRPRVDAQIGAGATEVCPYRATIASSRDEIRGAFRNAHVRRQEERSRADRLVSSAPMLGSDPTVASMRSSEPDPTRS